MTSKIFLEFFPDGSAPFDIAEGTPPPDGTVPASGPSGAPKLHITTDGADPIRLAGDAALKGWAAVQQLEASAS